MKAIILRGKRKGQEVEICQWCNDWFTIDDDPKPYSPSSLAFTHQDYLKILYHDNNGTLFLEFSGVELKKPIGKYIISFKRN